MWHIMRLVSCDRCTISFQAFHPTFLLISSLNILHHTASCFSSYLVNFVAFIFELVQNIVVSVAYKFYHTNSYTWMYDMYLSIIIDLANPKTNLKTSGFTVKERENFSTLLEENELVDSFRHLYPSKTAAYSYWSYRSNARKNNKGWLVMYLKHIIMNPRHYTLSCKHSHTLVS